MAHGEPTRDGSFILAVSFVAIGGFFFSLQRLFGKLAVGNASVTAFTAQATHSVVALAPSLLGIALRVWTPRRLPWGVRNSNHSRALSQFLTERPSSCCGSELSSRVGCPSSSKEWVWLMLRSVAGSAGIIFVFVSLQVMPLGTNSMLTTSSPAFIILWGAILTGDPVKPKAVICVLLCFVGLGLIVQPWQTHRDAPMWSYLLSLGSAATAGLVYLSLKELKLVSAHVSMSVFFTTHLVISVAVGLFLEQLHFPASDSTVWVYLFGMSLSAYAGEFLVTLGFAQATANSLGHVGVAKFLCPIFSVLWDLMLFDTVLGPIQLLGMSLVLGASAAITLQSTPSRDKNQEHPRVAIDDLGSNGGMMDLAVIATSGDQETSP
eukprot:TRINITY_DN7047_c0_g1_i2.p1 TRINITY_DN7047_c0_g1~~TRINITY_DN7047_c0_g1_i2.p1  ORF type:complete len:390 (-),score=39.29 TRINITY_DN7047_c0_g1_i2:170-1303(-)